jgi:hypothetical protein
MKREHVKVGQVVYDKVTGFFVKVSYPMENGNFAVQAGRELLRSERRSQDLRPLTARERGE